MKQKTKQPDLSYTSGRSFIQTVRLSVVQYSYRSLQNLMQLVLAAAYFASVVLDMKIKLRVMAGHILNAAKRVFGIPDFHYYAIADGLTNIFKRHPGRIVITATNRANQLPLFPD